MNETILLEGGVTVKVNADKFGFELKLFESNDQLAAIAQASYLGHKGFGNSTTLKSKRSLTENETLHIARVLYKYRVSPPTEQLKKAVLKEAVFGEKISQDYANYFAYLGVMVPEGVKVKRNV